MESLISKKECAALLGVSVRTIERQMKKGMPAIHVGSRWRFDFAEVIKWLKEQ